MVNGIDHLIRIRVVALRSTLRRQLFADGDPIYRGATGALTVSRATTTAWVTVLPLRTKLCTDFCPVRVTVKSCEIRN